MERKYLVLLFLVIIAFAQCTQKELRYYTQKDLPSSFYTLNVNRDTVVHTAKGALINIPKGSLSAGNAATVKLEIKEAHTIADMITAGLTTKAGKELLSSGGMIFVNAVDKGVVMRQSISISIPTAQHIDGMQRYKGEMKSDNTIDWTDPQPLPQQALSEHLKKGKALYMSNCASCHNTLRDATGPTLAYLYQRRNHKWLADFVHNSAKMIAEGDVQANCLYERWNKTAMVAFPTLSDEELEEIFDYGDYACKVPASTIPDYQLAFDSCKVYNDRKTALEKQRNELIKDNGRRVTRSSATTVMPTGNTPIDTGSLNLLEGKRLVTPLNDAAVYYQFEIESFGWYNVDILLKGLPGFENSELTVRLTGEFKNEINLYMVIPESKILLDGGLLEGKHDEYGFFADDGTIPLPQRLPAYILAMGEKDGIPYFGATSFTIALKQSLEVKVMPATKEQINEAISNLGFKDLKITATDSKTSSKLRSVDDLLKDIEELKPKGFDCNCGYNRVPRIDSTVEADTAAR